MGKANASFGWAGGRRQLRVAGFAKVALVLLAGLAVALHERVARGEGAPSIGDDMRGYYASERITGYAFLVFSTLSLAAGGVLVTRDQTLLRGMGWSALAVGALEVLGGAGYVLQMNARLDRASAGLARDPAAFQVDERAQVAVTERRYTMYRLLELTLAVAGAGAATYGFARHQDAWAGAGVGLAIEALVSLAIDSTGAYHTTKYQRQVEAFQPVVALQHAASDGSWTVSVGGEL